jgi:hypothetical protein
LKTDIIKRRALIEFSIEKGCELSDPIDLFTGIYVATAGNPCEGCTFSAKCVLLKKFRDADKAPASKINEHLKTHADLAKVYNVSKRQVAKHRIPGTNECNLPLPKTEDTNVKEVNN